VSGIFCAKCEMVGRNFIFLILFWLRKCDPRVTWMWNLCSVRRHLPRLILYGVLKFFRFWIWHSSTRKIGKIPILKIFKWNQRHCECKWCTFIMRYYYFQWVAMAWSHGMKYQEILFFHSWFSINFSEYHSTWVEIPKSANIRAPGNV